MRILSYEQFNDPEKVNERVEFFELAQKSSSKTDFRNKVVAQLQRVAPGLANDESFVEQIVDTYNEV